MTTKPKIMPDGIAFGDETLKNYDEGTWTPSSGGVGNITGTPSFGTATYTRIGNRVFAEIEGITGCSITTAGVFTYINIAVSGLPSFPSNANAISGTAQVYLPSPYESLPVTMYQGTNTVSFLIGSTTGLGVTNGDALSIKNIAFSYKI